MGGEKTTTTSTTQQLAPEQRELLDLVVPVAKDMATNTPDLYPGSTVAGFTPLQQAGQSGAVNTAVNFLDPFAGSTAAAHTNLQNAALPAGTSGLGNLISNYGANQAGRNFIESGAVLSPNSNPYLAQTADAAIQPVYDKLMQQVLPNIRAGAQASGQVGGSRQGIAEANAINDFARTAGNISSSVYSQGYGQGLSEMGNSLRNSAGVAGDAASSLLSEGTRSLFAAPSIAQLALLPSQILDAVGNTQQQMNQALLTEDANRFMTEQMMPWLIAQDVGNLAFGIPGGTTVSKVTEPGPSPLEIILGVASTAAGFM